MTEYKIGEVFEYNGEWYQCLKSDGTCAGCASYAGYGTGYSLCNVFGECTGKIFKKLKKVGKPCIRDGMICQFYALPMNVEQLICKDYWVTLIGPNIVEIEVVQNKEDIKEMTLDEAKKNLKPFNLEAAKAGKPVCTRDGRQARIICFDRTLSRDGYTYPILALVKNGRDEYVYPYTDGGLISKYEEHDADLMMAPEKKEGWVNIYRGQVYNTFEKAEEARKIAEYSGDNCLKTIKVEWEE